MAPGSAWKPWHLPAAWRSSRREVIHEDADVLRARTRQCVRHPDLAGLGATRVHPRSLRPKPDEQNRTHNMIHNRECRQDDPRPGVGGAVKGRSGPPARCSGPAPYSTSVPKRSKMTALCLMDARASPITRSRCSRRPQPPATLRRSASRHAASAPSPGAIPRAGAAPASSPGAGPPALSAR